MQIVDKEKEWLGEEDYPEGKRKKMLEAALIAMAAIGVFLLAHLLDGKSFAFGEPYLVKLGEVAVQPGKTTIQDLADAGYDFSDLSCRTMVREGEGFSFEYSEIYDLSSLADGNTIYTSITLVKDGQCVALVSAVNAKDEKIPLSECKVGGIKISGDYYESESVTLEGVSFAGLSAQALGEVLGEPKKVSDSGDSYRWERGAYYLVLTYREDGTLEGFHSKSSKFYGREYYTGGQKG